MKKNDWILIGVVLGVAVIFALIQFLIPSDTNASIQITTDGTVFGEYKLVEDTEIPIIEAASLTLKRFLSRSIA